MISLADSFILEVETEYVEELSVPEQLRYFFTYTITLTNPLSQSVSLMAMQLNLINSNGEVIELSNPFASDQYIIHSQQASCYSNDIITRSPLSIVEGKIELQLNASETLTIPIDPFRLVIPNLLH